MIEALSKLLVMTIHIQRVINRHENSLGDMMSCPVAYGQFSDKKNQYLIDEKNTLQTLQVITKIVDTDSKFF